MKLGELFIKLSTKGDTKNLEKALKQLKEAEKETRTQLKLKRDLAKATTEEEKQIIRKNHAQKKEIDVTQKLLNKQKERNQAIMAGIKGFAGFVTAVSLAIGVLDRFINSSAKANQSVLTISQSSGMSADLINKYASASMDKNLNVTREGVAQTINSLSQKLRGLQVGEVDESLLQGMQLLQVMGGSSFNPYGLNAEQFLEGLRKSLVGVDDEWASDILQRMGISPDLLPMLRMSKEEFDRTKNRFLNENEMTEQQKLVLELTQLKDQIVKAITIIANELIPPLNKLVEVINKLIQSIPKFLKGDDLPKETPEDIKEAITASRKQATAGTGVALATGRWVEALGLILSEIIGEGIFKEFKSSGFLQLSPYGVPAYNTGNTTNNFNTTINTTQPADKATGDSIERNIKNAQNLEQKVSR